MATPIELRAVYTLTASTTSKVCNLGVTFADTNYTVVAEFPYDTGGWYVDTKTTTSFKIYVVNSNVADKEFSVHIYWDSSTFEA